MLILSRGWVYTPRIAHGLVNCETITYSIASMDVCCLELLSSPPRVAISVTGIQLIPGGSPMTDISGGGQVEHTHSMASHTQLATHANMLFFVLFELRENVNKP